MVLSIKKYGLPYYNSSLPFEKLCGELRKYYSKSIPPIPQIMGTHLIRNCLVRGIDSIQEIQVYERNSSSITYNEGIIFMEYLGINNCDSIKKISKLKYKNKIYKSLRYLENQETPATNDYSIAYNYNNQKCFGEINYFIKLEYGGNIKILVSINSFETQDYEHFDSNMVFVYKNEEIIIIKLEDIISKIITYNFVSEDVIGVKEII